MSIENNKQLVRQFNAAFNRGDLDACGNLLAPHFLAYQPGVPQPLNVEAFRQVGQMFLDAFSIGAHDYQEQVGEGEYVVTRAIWSAVHNRGPFNGIPANGKLVSIDEVVFNRIVDGKIVEHRAIFDVMSFMQQLGAVPTSS
jgi:steroid delta-isomerase-like uncharacterized protein